MKKVIICIALLLALLGNCFGLEIYTETSAPMNFKNEKGELDGAGVEIVREIQKRVQSSEEIQLVPWARGYKYLQTKPNVALFSTGRTDQRENLFKWVGPIVRIKWALYGKNETPVLISLDEAKKLKQIATVREDAREQLLKTKGFTNLHSVSKNDQSVKMVNKGRAEAFASSNLGYEKTISGAGLNSQDYHEIAVIKTIDLYIAFSKETSETLVEKWQKALDEMKKDGSFAKIYQKWFPGEEIPVKPL